jgi:hypothetical protein
MKHATLPFVPLGLRCLATIAASALLAASLPAAAAGAADTAKAVPQRVKPGTAKPYIGGTYDGQSMRRKKPAAGQQPVAGKQVPSKRKNAQYNPKELGVDKRK